MAVTSSLNGTQLHASDYLFLMLRKNFLIWENFSGEK